MHHSVHEIVQHLGRSWRTSQAMFRLGGVQTEHMVKGITPWLLILQLNAYWELNMAWLLRWKRTLRHILWLLIIDFDGLLKSRTSTQLQKSGEEMNKNYLHRRETQRTWTGNNQIRVENVSDELNANSWSANLWTPPALFCMYQMRMRFSWPLKQSRIRRITGSLFLLCESYWINSWGCSSWSTL